MRRLVTPGESVPRETRKNDYVYYDNESPYSTILGFYDDDKNEVIPLEGTWKPRIGDSVIGIVSGISKTELYTINLTDFVRGIIAPTRFESQRFAMGDVIEATVEDVERKRIAVLSRPRKLANGRLVSVKPVRIPRIIGRNDTMIEQISRFTNTMVRVGRNGIIWLSGGNIGVAIEMIKLVEKEAHTHGLTERIRRELESRKSADGHL
ncbi:MAG: hypothetical protein M1125_02860 [Candidatus Marsarchaeota archaeon]|nr:hypothetical protein [Candidatus Marsarchaeota archaeon]